MMIFLNINLIIKAMLQIIIYDKPNKTQDVIEVVEGHRRITVKDKQQIQWQIDIKYYSYLMCFYKRKNLSCNSFFHLSFPSCLTVCITYIDMF